MMTSDAALAIRDDQPMWDDRQLAVLHQTGIPEDVSKAELAGFLHVCQRTRLDPFARQIYLIPRWNADLQREVYTPQTGIDGLRVIARRAAGSQLYYKGPWWCGLDGQWRDVWLEEGPPAAARIIICTDLGDFPGVATYREFAARKKDGTLVAMWAKMPANQLAKCAEAQALRKAFPNDLAGLYAAEETERAVQDELDARPVGRHMTRHVYEPDAVSRQWEAGTVQHDSVARQEELGKARFAMQEQLNRLGIWNRPERLAMVETRLREAGMWDTDRAPLDGFHEVSIAEALAVAARLAEEPTPDVDAGVGS